MLYHTSSEELTEANNAVLWARLDGANYGEDGLVKIDTDITVAELTIQAFYIAAVHPAGITVTDTITVTLSCVDVTSITTTYDSDNTVPFVVDYTAEGFFYRILIEELSTSETVDLSLVASYLTDRDPDCLSTGIDIVTDETGATAYTGSTFSEDALSLTIDTTAVFHGALYLKALTYVSTVF